MWDLTGGDRKDGMKEQVAESESDSFCGTCLAQGCGDFMEDIGDSVREEKNEWWSLTDGIFLAAGRPALSINGKCCMSLWREGH